MDFSTVRNSILNRLGSKANLFDLRCENNTIIAKYYPYNLDLVYVPSGTYTKGLTQKEIVQGRKINNSINLEVYNIGVENEVYISDFFVTRTPILNCFVKKYLNINHCKGEDYFAAYLDKESVDELCNIVGMRLPRENEWEYFARAGSSDIFSFGEKILGDEEMDKWLSLNFEKLEKLECNKFGLYGLYTGEWCSDYYNEAGSVNSVDEYVIKGGGAYFWPWQADEWVWCMSAMRMSSSGLIDNECGFRLVFDIDQN